MAKINIGLSTPKEFKVGSATIRLAQGTDFSHVFIRMVHSPHSKLAFDKVFQASHGDVNALKYDNFTKENKIIREYELEVSEDNYLEIVNYLWEQLGKKYGFMQLLGIYTGLKLGNNGETRFICTELAAMVLEATGVDVNGDKDYLGLNDIKNILDEIPQE